MSNKDLAIALDYDGRNNIEQKHFKVGDEATVFGPNTKRSI